MLGLDAALTDRWTTGLALSHKADIVGSDGNPLDDYTLVDGRVSYAFAENWEAWLRVENLLDEDYEVARTYNTAGRAWYFGVRASF